MPDITGSNQSWRDIQLEEIADRTLGEMFPCLLSLPGKPSVEALPSMVRYRVKENVALAWAALAELTVGEIMAWRATGEGKVRTLLEYLDGLCQPENRAERESSHRAHLSRQLIRALEEIAAWGYHNGSDSVQAAIELATHSSTPDVPVWAVEVLESVSAEELGRERLSYYDPSHAFSWLLEQMDERSIEILTERTLLSDAPPTLEQLGSRYGVTRERVRQVESATLGRLDGLLGSPEAAPLRRLAMELRESHGDVIPLRSLGVGHTSELDFKTKLVLWIAGPYEIDGDWIVQSPWKEIKGVLDYCYSVVEAEGRADHELLFNCLVENGVRPEFVDELVESVGGYRRVGSLVVPWGRTYGERSAAVLRLAGRPLLSSEILDEIGTGTIGSLRTALASDPAFVRVGKDRFGLSDWGGEEYEGVVPAMISYLAEHGAVSISQMATELTTAFGISPNSVSMNATMHPAFVAHDGEVRLRSEDEPYSPAADLGSAPGCWYTNGAWSLVLEIDEDIGRGSGRSIPEALAAHLGLEPGQSKSLGSDFGEVHFGWGQAPAIGSIRVAVEALGGGIGDRISVRFPNPFWVDFRLKRAGDVIPEPRERIAFLLGVHDIGESPEEFLRAAVGSKNLSDGSSEELWDLLERKRASEVLDALRLLTGGGSD